MKIRVFVSGEMEEDGLQRLLDKLLFETETHKYHSIKVTKLATGKIQFFNRVGIGVKNAFNDKNLKCVLTLEDSDKNDIIALEQKYKSKVDGRLLEKFHPSFAVREVETWILSDTDLLRRYKLENVIEYQDPENDINTKKKPSNYLNELFSSNDKKYKKTVDGVNLLSDLNIRTVYSKCPHFKKFIDTVMECLEIDNVYNA